MALNTNFHTGFYFELSFQGEGSPFQEVSGISMEMDTEEITEGGENRFTHLTPTRAKSSNLILKRGILYKDSKVMQWIKDTIGEEVSSAIITSTIIITLFNAKGNPTMGWVFHNAYPVKYSISSLESPENEVLIETIEFAYSYFVPNIKLPIIN